MSDATEQDQAAELAAVEELPEAEQDSRADAKALLMIFGAVVLIAVYFISGWTPFL